MIELFFANVITYEQIEKRRRIEAEKQPNFLKAIDNHQQKSKVVARLPKKADTLEESIMIQVR